MLQVSTTTSFIPSLFMMKHSYIRSFHASHQLNLQPMDNEREYLPWMSDPIHTHYLLCIGVLAKDLLTKMNRYHVSESLMRVRISYAYVVRYDQIQFHIFHSCAPKYKFVIHKHLS
jgi:hypothetical protein